MSHDSVPRTISGLCCNKNWSSRAFLFYIDLKLITAIFNGGGVCFGCRRLGIIRGCLGDEACAGIPGLSMPSDNELSMLNWFD